MANLQIKIKKQTEETVNIELPAFFDGGYDDYRAVYSEKKRIRVIGNSGILYDSDPLSTVLGLKPITEAQFTERLLKTYGCINEIVDSVIAIEHSDREREETDNNRTEILAGREERELTLNH